MLDLDTFLTTVYCLVDDVYQAEIRPCLPRRTGPPARLSDSEVLTVGLLAQWNIFPSQRAFWRWAQTHLRPYFPGLPSLSRFNRLLRARWDILGVLFRTLAHALAEPSFYRVVDATPVPVCKVSRWRSSPFRGDAALSWCATKQEWYFGYKLFVAVTPEGVITSAALLPANVGDRPGAESIFVQEQYPAYLADKGFCSAEWEQQWRESYGVEVVAAPFRRHKRAWPETVYRRMAGLRQIVEQVYGHLKTQFGLERVRARTFTGLWAALAAQLAAFTVAQTINARLHQPLFTCAALCAW